MIIISPMKTAPLLVRNVPKDLLDKLRKIAEKRGESRNTMIIDVLLAFAKDQDTTKSEARKVLGPLVQGITEWLESDE